MTPDPKAHESRMAELRERYRDPRGVLDYADQLHKQLEAERSRAATLDKELDRLDTAIDELCDAWVVSLFAFAAPLQVGLIRDP